ncbi:MAG: TPM domain-containing protein [Myxococcales bacterium]|nr:TPM domain-containing protein [Myxococcales bacterium]
MADLAPAESIAVDYAAVKQAFASGGKARFLDLSGRLTFDERKQVVARVEALAQKTGGRTWVLALPGKTDVNQFAKIHDELKLNGSDVLFIYSLQQRHLHNKALGKDVGNEILKKTNPTFYKQATQVQGVLETLDEFERRLATAAPGTTTPGVAVPAGAPVKKGPLSNVQPFAIVAVVAVVVWIALRRKQEPPKRPSLPKAKSRSSRPGDRADRTPVPGAAGKSTTGSGKSTTGSGKATTGSGKAKTEPDADADAPPDAS